MTENKTMYWLDLDGLSITEAGFVQLGAPAGVNGRVKATMPRETWESAGRPHVVTLITGNEPVPDAKDDPSRRITDRSPRTFQGRPVRDEPQA